MRSFVYTLVPAAVGLAAAALLAGCPPNLGGTTMRTDAGGGPPPDTLSARFDTLQPTIDQPVFPGVEPLPDASVTRVDSPVGPPHDSSVTPHDTGTMSGGGDATIGMSGCNPVTQSCTSSTTPKCAVTIGGTSTMPTANPVCTTNGTVAVGSSCDLPTKTFGIDNCAKGGLCWVINPPASGATPTGTCRAYCSSDSSCGSAKCGNEFGAAYGLCLPTCTIGSTGCGSGASCNVDLDIDGTTNILNCQPYGTTALGGTCTYNGDCVANAACLYPSSTATSGNCYQLCNPSSTSGCPSGKTCMMLATGIGYCG